MKYRHDKENKQIIFDTAPRKGKNAIKVLFYRLVDEREKWDYPVAYADIKKGQKVFDWVEDVEILEILVKEPRYLGLFGSRWKVVDKHI
jgi:hypothetical protein